MVRRLLLGFALVCAAGCGGAAGTAGDERDPETTTDVEQMADETDTNITGGGANKPE